MTVRVRRTEPVRRREPTQERSRARQQAIIAAAAREFAEHGFERATTAAIARRARVPVGSLYQYFPRKDLLLGAAMSVVLEDAERVVRAIADPIGLNRPLPAVISTFVDELVAFFARHPIVAALLANAEDPAAGPFVVVLRSKFEVAMKHLVEARASGLDTVQAAIVTRIASHQIALLQSISESRNGAESQALVAEAKVLLERYLAPYDRQPRQR